MSGKITAFLLVILGLSFPFLVAVIPPVYGERTESAGRICFSIPVGLFLVAMGIVVQRLNKHLD